MKSDSFSRDEAGAAAHAQILGRHEHIGNPDGDQEPDPTQTQRGWTCTSCRVKHWDGDPWIDGCSECRWTASPAWWCPRCDSPHFVGVPENKCHDCGWKDEA